MVIKIESIRENASSLMRRAGYIFQRNEGDEMSFIRPMARSGYPRFHVYAKMSGVDLIVKIHLDQKKQTHGSGTRHHGEYEDNKLLEQEVMRIKHVTS